MRRPCCGKDADRGMVDGFKAGETVGYLGAKLRFGGVSRVGQNDLDFDAVLLRNAGDSPAWGIGIGDNRDGADEAEINDIAGEFWIVAVAKSGEDIGFGEHQ